MTDASIEDESRPHRQSCPKCGKPMQRSPKKPDLFRCMDCKKYFRIKASAKKPAPRPSPAAEHAQDTKESSKEDISSFISMLSEKERDFIVRTEEPVAPSAEEDEEQYANDVPADSGEEAPVSRPGVAYEDENTVVYSDAPISPPEPSAADEPRPESVPKDVPEPDMPETPVEGYPEDDSSGKALPWDEPEAEDDGSMESLAAEMESEAAAGEEDNGRTEAGELPKAIEPQSPETVPDAASEPIPAPVPTAAPPAVKEKPRAPMPKSVVASSDGFTYEINIDALLQDICVSPNVIFQIQTHLKKGRNIIIYGPPGSGKYKLATDICRQLCGVGVCSEDEKRADNWTVANAGPQWTFADLLGAPIIKGGEDCVKRVPLLDGGNLMDAVKGSICSLEESGRPHYLILKNLHRIRDKDFLRELMDLLERGKEAPLMERGGEVLGIPDGFRIISLYDTYQKDLLFTLGTVAKTFAIIEMESPDPRAERVKIAQLINERFIRA